MPDLKTVTFDALCASLPEGVAWGEPLTPEIAKHIADAYREPAAQSAGQEAVAYVATLKDDGDRFLVWPNNAAAYLDRPQYFSVEPLYRHAASVNGGERVQWWLADIDMHGNPTLSDGAHSDRAGADKAAYLHAALGLKHDRKFAVARVELFDPKPNAEGVNHEAVSQCNAMSERAADAQQVSGDASALVRDIKAAIGELSGGITYPDLINAIDQLAALTSPAKVGGDEREAFEQWAKHRKPRPLDLTPFEDTYDSDFTSRAWDAWQARAALSADGGEAANLEGLRDKLFDGRPVTRDAEGWYYHPALPNTDEDVNFGNLLAALRVESVFVSMEVDDSKAADRYGEAGEADCHYWTPTPPEGDDWCLLAVYDTEDGPYALFGRDAYVAEQKRKQDRTRQRAEAIAANQAKGDAS